MNTNKSPLDNNGDFCFEKIDLCSTLTKWENKKDELEKKWYWWYGIDNIYVVAKTLDFQGFLLLVQLLVVLWNL